MSAEPSYVDTSVSHSNISDTCIYQRGKVGQVSLPHARRPESASSLVALFHRTTQDETLHCVQQQHEVDLLSVGVTLGFTVGQRLNVIH